MTDKEAIFAEGFHTVLRKAHDSNKLLCTKRGGQTMKRLIMLLGFLAILLAGCVPKDSCRETCYSKDLSYYKYVDIPFGDDKCLCITDDDEIISVW